MSSEADAVRRTIVEWAAGDPNIRRVWIFRAPVDSPRTEGGGGDGGLAVAVEPQPVGDSVETFPIWMAHCAEWHRQLQARIGYAVPLEWFDPDKPYFDSEEAAR